MGFLSDNFIADGIFVVIKWMFEFIHDYSIVILLITLAIRIVVLPLDIKQRKNTRMMANLGPEMESLKKRYANNPDQMNRKMQELYRERNVKPMAGCLPMILQLFLLFAFFGALRNKMCIRDRPPGIRGSNIHARALAPRVQALQNLDLIRVIGIAALCHMFRLPSFSIPVPSAPRALPASCWKWGNRRSPEARFSRSG